MRIHPLQSFSKADRTDAKYAVLLEASNAHVIWSVYDTEQSFSVALRWRSLPVTSRDVESRTSKEVLAGLVNQRAANIFLPERSCPGPAEPIPSVPVFLLVPPSRRSTSIIESNICFLFEHAPVTLYRLTHGVFRRSTELCPPPPTRHVAHTIVATSAIPPNCLLILAIGEDLIVSTDASARVLGNPSVHTTSIVGKLRALHERTGALPLIHLNDLVHHLPVPFLADTTIAAMLTCVLREMALTLRSLIHEWAISAAEQHRVVLLAGTEAPLHKSLLGPDVSNRVVEIHNSDAPWEWQDEGASATIPGVRGELQFQVEEFVIDQAVGVELRKRQAGTATDPASIDSVATTKKGG